MWKSFSHGSGVAVCGLLVAAAGFTAVVRGDQPGTVPPPAAAHTSVYSLWPGEPPAWNPPSQPERDTTGPDGRRVAGKPVVRLGFVSEPQLHVYHVDPNLASDTAVIICPGGGYSILAWDLEGTEIAEWLRGIGVTAAVLKYRVPTRNESSRWLPPVQDIQRAISLMRSGGLDGVRPARIGVLGFSAGGNASARAATATKRTYKPVDAQDRARYRPDFGVLVYPAWLVESDDPTKLIEDIRVDETTPPMFFAHARDDRVTCMSSVTMFSELNRNGVPAALHIFSAGGHGFGGRDSGSAESYWPALCEAWMREHGWLKP